MQNSILNSCDPNGLQKVVIEEYYSLIKSQTFTFAMLASTAAAGGAAGSSLVPKTIPAQILATLGSAAAAAYSGATIAFQVFQQQMNNDYDIGSSNIYGDYQSNYEFTFPNQSTRTGSSDMCNDIAFTSDWNDQGFTYSGLVMSTRTFTYE